MITKNINVLDRQNFGDFQLGIQLPSDIIKFLQKEVPTYSNVRFSYSNYKKLVGTSIKIEN